MPTASIRDCAVLSMVYGAFYGLWCWLWSMELALVRATMRALAKVLVPPTELALVIPLRCWESYGITIVDTAS